MPNTSRNTLATNPTIHLKDYQQPNFWVKGVSLCFDLSPESTLVTAMVQYERNQAGGLQLDGEGLQLESIKMDGSLLHENQYQRHEKGLLLTHVPDAFSLEIVTRIAPENN
ncbi:MAG: aminopeptidase N, partial [Ghiorsea sp.]